MTTTIPLALAAHPAALVTVTEKVPPVFVVKVDVVSPLLHKYVLPPLAVNIPDVPEHTVSLLTEGIGYALTVTSAFVEALQP